jgi:hypothetical protein
MPSISFTQASDCRRLLAALIEVQVVLAVEASKQGVMKQIIPELKTNIAARIGQELTSFSPSPMTDYQMEQLEETY